MSKLDLMAIDSSFGQWEDLREQLAPMYKTKDSARSSLLEKGITLLGEIIELTEDAKPVNFQERFDFIVHQKQNYTAFKQLDELFKETKKKVAVLRLRQMK